MSTDVEDAASTLDWTEQAEARVLQSAVSLCDAMRWGLPLVNRAASAAGLSTADAALLLPGGPRDLAALLSHRHDRVSLQQLASIGAATLKVRERIVRGVDTRIAAAMQDEAAVRRASVFLARPDNAALALRLAWESADGLWRWAGDTATDENHYSKRAILAGVLVSTLAVRLSAGAERAERYLQARIADVMAFERWKGGLPRPAEALTAAARLLGRLRYGAADPD